MSTLLFTALCSLLLVVACAPAAPVAPAPAAGGQAAAQPAGEMTPVTYTLAATSSEARYLVKETLAGFPLPSDAVGRTRAVSGAIAFDKTGAVDSARSKITIDLATLKSDPPPLPVNNRAADEVATLRDNFVRDRLLQVSQFPPGEFVPTRITGLKAPFPSTGKADFQLTGDLTAHGVTRQVTWDVSAEFKGNEVVGTARAKATLADFNITKPTLTLVLSIDDELRLELDFKATKAN